MSYCKLSLVRLLLGPRSCDASHLFCASTDAMCLTRTASERPSSPILNESVLPGAHCILRVRAMKIDGQNKRTIAESLFRSVWM